MLDLEGAILGLLKKEPMSGYQVKIFYRDVIKSFWNISDGHLYPTLRRMTTDGLVEKKTAKRSGKGNKYIYSITQKGEREFHRWLKDPVKKFELLKEPLILKLFFFEHLSREEMLEPLMIQLDVHEKVLSQVKNTIMTYFDSNGEKVSPYQMFVGDVGAVYLEFRIFWLKRLIERVRENKTGDDNRIVSEKGLSKVQDFFDILF